MVKIVFIQKFLQSKLLLIILLIYFLLGVYLIRFYRFQINPDGISLINIARAITEGNFKDAVNGYWGILFSLILSPFLFLPLNYLFAEKIMSLILGAFTVTVVYLIILDFNISHTVRRLLMLAIPVLILYFAFSIITADLLLITLLLFYIHIILKKNYLQKNVNGILVGFLGGLIYLSKEYGFSFFLVHYTLINLVYFIFSDRMDKVRIFKTFILGISIFAIITLSWVYILGIKYNQIMIGSRGTYNWAIYGPKFPNHPVYTNGFISPPSLYSTSAWDDPTYTTNRGWNIFESIDTFKYLINRIITNIRVTLFTYKLFSPLLIPVNIFLIGYIFFRLNQVLRNSNILVIFLSLLIYSSGYILVHVEERFLWFNFVLLFIVGGYFLDKLTSPFNAKRGNNLILKGISLGVTILFVFLFIKTPARYLITNLNIDRNFYNQSKILSKDYITKNVKLASNENWNGSLYLAFHTQSKYFGISSRSIDYNKLLADFNRFGIEYYLVWDNDDLANLLTKDFDELKIRGIDKLRIFKINIEKGKK